MFVDPEDVRGQRLLLRRGALDRHAIIAWGLLCDDIDPTLLIDVGANYGEVVLSRSYMPGAEIHVVEANPYVADRLERSITQRSEEITLHRGAASDEHGTVALEINPRSSGTSSVQADGLQVPCFRMDQVIGPGRHRRMVFKIDVEGHEPAVLKGMRRLLEVIPEWAGLCEVNRLQMSVVEPWYEDFDISVVEVRAGGRLRPAPPPADLMATIARNDVSKDIVLQPKRRK